MGLAPYPLTATLRVEWTQVEALQGWEVQQKRRGLDVELYRDLPAVLISQVEQLSPPPIFLVHRQLLIEDFPVYSMQVFQPSLLLG